MVAQCVVPAFVVGENCHCRCLHADHLSPPSGRNGLLELSKQRFRVSLLLSSWAVTGLTFLVVGSSSLELTGMAARVWRDIRRSAGEPNVWSRGLFLRFRILRNTSDPSLCDFSMSCLALRTALSASPFDW